MSTKNEKTSTSTTIRVFSQDEKDRIFKLYKEGKNLKDIAEDLNLDFTSSEHKINEKTGKETGTAANVTINGNKYGLKQLLFYLDKDRAAIEYETGNYKKGGRPLTEKVNNAVFSFISKLEELTSTKFITDDSVVDIDIQAIYEAAFQIAEAKEAKEAAEKEAKREAEKNRKQAEKEAKQAAKEKEKKEKKEKKEATNKIADKLSNAQLEKLSKMNAAQIEKLFSSIK